MTSRVTNTAAIRMTVLTIDSKPNGVPDERPLVTSRVRSFRPDTMLPHRKYVTGIVGKAMMPRLRGVPRTHQDRQPAASRGSGVPEEVGGQTSQG